MIVAIDLWFGGTGFGFTMYLFEFDREFNMPRFGVTCQIKILGKELYNSEVTRP
jgi:hypothetical protein